MPTATERIEDIRVSWERDLEVEAEAKPRKRRPPGVDPGERDRRVPLERAMAERVHRVADDAARRLGCPDRFVLCQTPLETPHLSAQALLDESPFAIRLIGPIARSLDDDALAALIGHELGHWLALGPRAEPPSSLLQAWEHGAPRHVVRLGILASELTADRFSLIAAGGELEAAVRLDVASATLDSPQAMGLRELDYLAGLCRKVEASQAPVFRGVADDYPSSAFRLYATQLFWRSDVHRELTGAGPGDLVLRDVDATLRAIADRAIAQEPMPDAGRLRAARPESAAATAPSPLWASVEHEAREVASSVATAVGKFMGEVMGRCEKEPEIEDANADGEAKGLEGVGVEGVEGVEELDELEVRFRELEKRMGRG